MKYLLLICATESTDDVRDDGAPESDAPDLETWLEETGARRLLGSELTAPAEAITVRRRKGETVLLDGPYAETKEWIAGFDLIECANLDEAIEIASGHPMATLGMVEIRALVPES